MSAGAGSFVAVGDNVSPAPAGTAKSVLKVLAAANRAFKVTEVGVGFIGSTGSAKPVLVELCTGTEAGAGSGSSAVTPAQDDASDGNTVQATAAKGFTSEPTVLTPVRRWRVHPQAGQITQLPLGREVRSGVGKSVCLRVTFETGEATTNVDSYIGFEE